MISNEPLQLKEESLRWIFSIFGALLVYLIAALIIHSVYHPDIDHLFTIAKQVLAEPGKARPEPMEAMLFRVGIATILPSLCLFYILLSKVQLAQVLTGKQAFTVISACSIILVVLTIVPGFLAENTSDNTSRFIPLGTGDVGNINFLFFFNGFFLGSYFWLYTLVIVPSMCYLFLARLKKDQWGDKKAITTTAQVIGYTVTGGTLLGILLMNTFSFPYSVENQYDFSAVYYSMTQVFAGIPMLVNGFTNTYGLYPHFLAPIFRLTGLSICSFSLVMSLLQVLSFALNFYVLKKFTGNKVILFAGFASLLFFGYLDRKLLNHYDSFFALFPIRYMIPSILLFLATRYVSAPSKKLYGGIFVIMATFVLWNPEIGVVCYLSWIALNVYRDFYSNTGKINYRAILLHIVTGIGTALLVFYAFKLIIRVFYGAWPDLGLLGGTISVFSSVGFDLLPMDIIHPWNLAALIIIIGFMYAIARWHRKNITPKASIILLLSLISLGYLFYFQGRSHNSSLSASMGFCILLLSILGDELWGIVKKSNELFFSALFSIFLFLISFSFIELLFNAPAIAALTYQQDDKNNYADVQEDVAAGKALVENTSQENQKILVLAQKKHQPLFFDGNKRISAFNPGSIDLFLQADVHRLEKMIVDSSFNIYWEAENVFYPFMSLPCAAMAATYTFKSYDLHTLVLLTKRTIHITPKAFFDHRDATALHRKYNDDTTGTQLRINDAMGIAPVGIDSEFSVEALFYNVSQMFPDATIVSNAQDPSGFTISRDFNASRYSFTLGGARYRIPFPDNAWTYIVMNVYPTHVDIYRNGSLLQTNLLRSPMLPSKQQLFIGNLEQRDKAHFYVGPIAEVNISNKTLDSNQIHTTWTNIQPMANK